MNKASALILCLASAIAAVPLTLQTVPSSAQIGLERPRKVQIELIAEKAAVRPGDRITIALRQTITPGWHTYWVNPGDSGEPTRIDWTLPSGSSAGPIQWPLPEAIPVGPLMNFGYSDEVVLLSDITVPGTATGPSFDIAADVKWLVCEEICIPEQAPASLSLPLIDAAINPRPSANAKIIAEARKKVPEPMPWPAVFDAGADRVALKVEGAGESIPERSEIHFFPLQWGHISHSAPQKAAFADDGVVLSLARGDFSDDKKPAALDGVIAVETRGANGAPERHGYSISATPSEQAILSPAAAPVAAGGAPEGLSLIVALGFAFLGGLILNLMPCVFPVLSLKAISLAKSGDDNQERRVKGLIYLAGVLTSFAAVAGALVALRESGELIGWGMQFQSPIFVLGMMALFMALGLNLSGVFTLGTSITGLGDSLTRRTGHSGDFFTGVLATLVATPCTAPFMGAAMGYAFTQPAPVIFAVLVALGLGFALPILLLSLSPALGRRLPKPGPWMETFKQVMAFPLYATVGWLLWVLSVQQGSDGVLAGVIALVGIAFAAWVHGRSFEVSHLRSLAAFTIAIFAIGLGSWGLAGTDGRQPPASTSILSEAGPNPEPFTQTRLSELISRNKPVFVNLTAAWCITCKVNERIALRSERFAKALADGGVTYLVGDWTNGNPEITGLLKTHGRVGVPLYLLYSGAPGATPEILPQILTESMIVDRLAAISSPALKQAKGDH